MTVIRVCLLNNSIYIGNEQKRDYSNETKAFFDLLATCWSVKVKSTSYLLFSTLTVL